MRLLKNKQNFKVMQPSQRWRYYPPNEFPSQWACEWGADNYGLWQQLNISNVRYKLRFVTQGSFIMGSPENEPQRRNDENQRHVSINIGFWLGETAVPQELWEVVVGDNPSEFRAIEREKLPVESVSWEDCKKFCELLTQLKPKLHAQIPPETLWEYSCRAGTSTIFSLGNELLAAQANFDGRNSVALSSLGNESFRRRPVDIDQFPANPWGFKQMHGNVWEWCIGTDDQPVARGGSWLYPVDYCRSASRSEDCLGRDVGFRLYVLDI